MAIHDAARQGSTGRIFGAAVRADGAQPAGSRRALAAQGGSLERRGGADFHAILACLTRPPLADAGTLMLCEASWRMPRHRWVEFAPGLAEALKMSFAFLPSFGRVTDGGEFRALGNAILCAQPLDDFRAVALAKPPDQIPGSAA